jgi:ketosteroid isomerase-like protein
MVLEESVTTRDDVDAINNEYAKSMAGQDVDRMISLYARDARLFFSDTPIIRGHQAVAAFYNKEFEEGPITITFDSVDVVEGGDLVVDLGRYTTPNEQGKYVVVFQRQNDGTLKILVEADITDGLRSRD